MEAWRARQPPPPPPPPQWWESYWPPDHPIWKNYGKHTIDLTPDPTSNLTPLGFSNPSFIAVPGRKPGGWRG